jgi:hypothetical protein
VRGFFFSPIGLIWRAEVWLEKRASATKEERQMMVRLSLADGTRVHLNKDAIAYMQRIGANDDKASARTKVVFLSGQELSVRQVPEQVLKAMGEPIRKKRQPDQAE